MEWPNTISDEENERFYLKSFIKQEDGVIDEEINKS